MDSEMRKALRSKIINQTYKCIKDVFHLSPLNSVPVDKAVLILFEETDNLVVHFNFRGSGHSTTIVTLRDASVLRGE